LFHPGGITQDSTDHRNRRHSARSAATVLNTPMSEIGRQQPQPPTETSDPRRVRVE
jgi:hypothetical protein